jgi:hypothetical protein
MSSQDNRQDATYVFLDKTDAAARDIRAHLGYNTNYAIVRVKIPREEAAKMRDDGLFNGTFSSYSAARIFRSVPKDWIDDVEYYK